MRKFNRVFMRGDTHRDFRFLKTFCRNYNTTTNDLLIILGDAGINYLGAHNDEFIKIAINSCPITLLMVHGNHEEYPANIESYVKKDVGIGGKVFVERDFPNLWFAQDGGEYVINDKTFLTVGGAYSVDKDYRLQFGLKWFESEQIATEGRMKILDDIYRKHYNYVLTHTCPTQWMPVDLFLSGIDQSKIDRTMENFLEDVETYCEYDNWYFGHFHCNRTDICRDGKVNILFDKIVELEI